MFYNELNFSALLLTGYLSLASRMSAAPTRTAVASTSSPSSSSSSSYSWHPSTLSPPPLTPFFVSQVRSKELLLPRDRGRKEMCHRQLGMQSGQMLKIPGLASPDLTWPRFTLDKRIYNSLILFLIFNSVRKY